MKIVASTGTSELAVVYVAEDEQGRRLEFVESLEPPYSRDEKWVNIISTLWGCPIKCKFCDAGLQYKGKVSAETMLAQLDALVDIRYPKRKIPSAKWKIQFARMGEPAFNRDVIRVLELLPTRYDALGLLPSVSTVGPKGCTKFFSELLAVKHDLYSERFQFQFSLHSTDPDERQSLIPAPTMSFSEMAEYGERIYGGVGRKVTLNFALGLGITVDPNELRRFFTPDAFIIKLTPMNPTIRASQNGYVDESDPALHLKLKSEEFRNVGYDVIESLGELEENAIGSNCGQYLAGLDSAKAGNGAYSYDPVQMDP